MPHTMTNRGLFYLQNNAISASTDFRCLVFKTTTPSVAAIRDYNFVSDLLAATTEAAASGYARVDLAGVAISESDASDNVTITATAPTITSVAAGETWLGVAYYIEGASDAARTLISVDVPASSVSTNGGDITLPQMSYTVTGS
jgi:hypothetical protein